MGTIQTRLSSNLQQFTCLCLPGSQAFTIMPRQDNRFGSDLEVLARKVSWCLWDFPHIHLFGLSSFFLFFFVSFFLLSFSCLLLSSLVFFSFVLSCLLFFQYQGFNLGPRNARQTEQSTLNYTPILHLASCDSSASSPTVLPSNGLISNTAFTVTWCLASY